MREIKFRFFTPDKRMVFEHDGWIEGIGINEALEYSSGYGYKIMQFTGLKDKNGKEIYIDDVILDTLTKAKYVVCSGFCKKYAFTGWYVSGINIDQELAINNDSNSDRNIHIEVIGNIHENPDLLK